LTAAVALVATAVLASSRLRALAGARGSAPTRPPGRHEEPPPSEQPPLVDVTAVNTTPSLWRESR
jgi:hypothetical protein